MPSAVPITLTDAAMADKVFNPLSVNPRSTVYINRDAQSAAASKKITLGFNPASATRKTDHATIRLDFPLEALVDGRYTVTDRAIFDCKFTIPTAFTQAHRADLLAQVRDLLGEAVVTSLVSELEPPY